MEGFQQLQTLSNLFNTGFRTGAFQLFTQLGDFSIQIHVFHVSLDSFGTHQRREFFTFFFSQGVELFFAQDLTRAQAAQTRIGHHVGFEIQDPLDVTQRHIQHQTNAARQ